MVSHGTVPREDWDHRLYNMMIKAGTDGIGHQSIIHRFQAIVTADMIKAKLEAWLAEQKVQKFEQRTKGRPRIIWRATKLLLTEYDRPAEKDEDDDD